jgi:enamine deaminase RidA (YjgF/YER057c/UK114 family)
MAIEHFVTHDIPQPVTGNFSHAVRPGGFVFLSGAAPFDPATCEIPAGIEDQIRAPATALERLWQLAGRRSCARRCGP